MNNEKYALSLVFSSMLEEATKIVEELNGYITLNLKNIIDSNAIHYYAKIADFLTHNLEMDEDYVLSELLEIEGIYSRFCSYYSSLEKLFDKVYIIDMLRRQSSTTTLYESETNTSELIQKIRELTSSLDSNTGRVLAEIHELIAQTNNQIMNLHEEKFPALTIEKIEYFYRKYVSEDTGYTADELDSKRKFLRKHVGNNPIDQWERMYNDILDVEDYAIAGKLIESDSYDYLFEKDDKESLQRDYQIVSIIQYVSRDDKLFDFHLAEQRQQLLHKLNADNINTLFQLVHIENIIKCKIHPELTAENDRFLNPKEPLGIDVTPYNSADILSPDSKTKHVVPKEETISFASYVVDQSKAPQIIKRLHEMIDKKIKPIHIMMPIRAAMNAGKLHRPTYESFQQEFGEKKVKSKSSFSLYTNVEKKTYTSNDFTALVEEFKGI